MTKYIMGMASVLIFALCTDASAGHCRKGNQNQRIKCLNSEVAYLTVLDKRQKKEIGELRQDVDELIAQSIPMGTVLAWNVASSEPPKGWEFCDGLNGKPNLDGRWLVGTNSPDKVGQPTQNSSVTLSATTGESVGDNKFSWGDTENNTPHATGLDHKHHVSVVVDPATITPPSVYVRFICKAR